MTTKSRGWTPAEIATAISIALEEDDREAVDLLLERLAGLGPERREQIMARKADLDREPS